MASDGSDDSYGMQEVRARFDARAFGPPRFPSLPRAGCRPAESLSTKFTKEQLVHRSGVSAVIHSRGGVWRGTRLRKTASGRTR